MSVCSTCGAECPPAFRHCARCGGELPREEAAGEVRKTVTILFTDLVSSTAMGERLDPEAVRRVMDRYFDAAREAIEHHGGVVEKFIGDAVMAVFGVPFAHEDDPLRAARAALELRDRLVTLNEEFGSSMGLKLQIRTGIFTGSVIAGTLEQGDRIVTGDAVNVAARLEQAAEPGAILLGDATYGVLRDAIRAEPMPPLDLKGKSGPTRAWRLLDIAEDAESLHRRLDMPLVGRAEELATLAEALERARRTRSPQLVTVLGAPGVGKTRLVQEAVARMGPGVTVLRGRVQAYGERVAFRPLVEMLEGLGGDTLARRLAGTPGGDQAALTLARLIRPDGAEAELEEIPRAVRILFESVGRERPLVLVIDDVHWAEPPMLDLIEHLTLRTRDTMLVVICIARTELLDAAPDRMTLAEDAVTIDLDPLEHDQSELIVGNLLGGMPVDPTLVTRVTETCEGNPLFIEQFVGSLLDDGSLRREGPRWIVTRELRRLPTPASVTALLEARLERLPAPERGLLERAAVEGMRFHEASLRELAPELERTAIDRHLHVLIRRGLIRPEEPFLPGYDAFRFAHVLVHEAAYARVPKGTRAEHHERYADWLEAVCAPLGSPVDETTGWHLERAYHLQRELGRRDEHVHELGLRAGATLEAAGRREEDRGNHSAAYRLFLRASALPAPAEVARGHRLLDATLHARETDEALTEVLRVIDEADHVAADTGDRSLMVRARAQRSEVAGTMAEHRLPYDRATEAAWLEQALDDRTLDARARDDALWALWMLRMDRGDVASLYDLAEEMITEAEVRGSAHRRRRAMLAWMTTAWVCQHDVSSELRRVRVLADEWRADAVASERLAALEALQLALMGRHEEALEARERQLASGRETPRGLTGRVRDPQLDGLLAMARGDLEEAARHQRVLVQRTDEKHAGAYASSNRLILARTLLLLGRPRDLEEAAEVLEQASRQHIPGDMINETYLPECRSLLAARRGDVETAAREARTAVEVADTTGWLVRQADARVTLAFALSAAGRREESEEAERDALALYTRSGTAALADRAREFLSQAPSRR